MATAREELEAVRKANILSAVLAYIPQTVLDAGSADLKPQPPRPAMIKGTLDASVLLDSSGPTKL